MKITTGLWGGGEEDTGRVTALAQSAGLKWIIIHRSIQTNYMRL